MSNPIPIIRKLSYTGTRHTLTTTFNGSLNINAWGGGGGGGGTDAGTLGGVGAPGLYNSLNVNFNKGDIIEVIVGGGGKGGIFGKSSDGGAPGSSGLNINGSAFNGGKGGKSGPIGLSGSGGGGGGATVILKNGVILLVAGGGAGGGGAGNDGNSATSAERRTGNLLNNATGQSVADYRGENGQDKTGDGGAGGGGGGGYPGGQGGAVIPGDKSAFAGQSGGNYPIGDAYYQSAPWFIREGVASYSGFLKKYGVWPSPAQSESGTNTYTVYRTFSAPFNGTYNFKFSVDNSGSLYVNDNLLTSVTGNNFGKDPTPVSLSLTKGTHRLKLIVTNTGGPGSFGLTIEDTSGGLLWDSRRYADVYPPGKDNKHYVKGVARGGQVNGNGGNGLAVLEFLPIIEYKASSAIKIAGSWKQVTNSYVKVSGTWKNIVKTYIKVNGTWRPIESSTDTTLAAFTSSSVNFGVNPRPFT